MTVRYSFLSVHLKTGDILSDLPDLRLDNFKTSIGRYETGEAVLPLPTAPVDWEYCTMPGAAAIIIIAQNEDDDDNPVGDPIIIGGGVVIRQTRSELDTVSLSYITLEGYLDRRHVGDSTYTGEGQNLIVEDLIENYVADGINGGIPIRVEVVTSGDGVERDREYNTKDEKTVYSVLTDLMSIVDGPEWYIGWEWTHDPEKITPVLYVGDRVGTAVGVGGSPVSTFELPGSVVSFEYVVDYSSNYGANSVVATSSGQGDSKPESATEVFVDDERPTYEYRWTPSTSVSDVDTLSEQATKALETMQDGSRSLALTAVSEYAPRLGVDWNLGDEVGYILGTMETETTGDILVDTNGIMSSDGFVSDSDGLFEDDDFVADTNGLYEVGDSLMVTTTESTVPAFPAGFSGIGRVVGWELDFSEPVKVTPILIIPGDDT